MYDTSPAARDAIIAAIRGMTPAERLSQALHFSEQTLEVALAGLRARYPGKTEREILELLLGRPLRTLCGGSANPGFRAAPTVTNPRQKRLFDVRIFPS